MQNSVRCNNFYTVNMQAISYKERHEQTSLPCQHPSTFQNVSATITCHKLFTPAEVEMNCLLALYHHHSKTAMLANIYFFSLTNLHYVCKHTYKRNRLEQVALRMCSVA